MMGLEALLESNEAAIVKKWFDTTIDTYPTDTSQFLRQQKDSFANPVGNTIRENLAALFQGLIRSANRDNLSRALDPIVRIRAVQDFTPSQAIGFIRFLKDAIRGQLASQLKDPSIAEAMLEFESRIDTLSLLAFDVYMDCREKLYQIKSDQEQKRALKVFERAGLIADGDHP